MNYIDLGEQARMLLAVEDYLSKKVFIGGTTGAGKSNTVAVHLEELMAVIPFAIIDPHGEYFTIRAMHPALIIGNSENCDMVLKPDQVGAIARWCYHNGKSVILDLYRVVDKEERLEYVVNFCGAIWNDCRKLSLGDHQPYGVVIDEAHNFIPERANTPALEMLNTFATEGRKFGLLVLASTQRTALISKTFLGMCDIRFFHRVSDQPDVDAMKARLLGSPSEIKRIVTTLKRGEAVVKTPELQVTTQIRERHTPTAAAAPRLKQEGKLQQQAVNAAEIESLRAALEMDEQDSESALERADNAALVERLRGELDKARTAEPELVISLRRKIRELETRSPEIREIALPILTPENERLVRDLVELNHRVSEMIADLLATLKAEPIREGGFYMPTGGFVNGDRLYPVEIGDPVPISDLDHHREDAGHYIDGPGLVINIPVRGDPLPNPFSGGAGDETFGALDKAALIIMGVLAQRCERPLTRGELGLLSGYSARGGAFQRHLTALSNLDFWYYPSKGMYQISETGLEWARQNPLPPPMNAHERLAWWVSKLQESMSERLLDTLVARYPQGYNRENLGAAAQREQKGGAFQRAISELVDMELVVLADRVYYVNRWLMEDDNLGSGKP